MKITAIIAEQVVSGFLLILWIVLFAVEPEAFNKVAFLDISVYGLALIPITLLVLVLLYVLGVVSDRISDIVIGYIFGSLPKSKVMRSEVFGGLSESDINRIEILVAEGALGIFIDYLRIVIRLSRTASFNLLPITIAVYLHTPDILILSIGVFLWLGSVLTWVTLSSEYQMTLTHGVKLNKSIQSAKVAD